MAGFDMGAVEPSGSAATAFVEQVVALHLLHHLSTCLVRRTSFEINFYRSKDIKVWLKLSVRHTKCRPS
jgi:hypothetical protein